MTAFERSDRPNPELGTQQNLVVQHTSDSQSAWRAMQLGGRLTVPDVDIVSDQPNRQHRAPGDGQLAGQDGLVALNQLPERQPAIPELVRQLGDGDFNTREAAHAALSRAGERAVPGLVNALASSDPEIRLRANSILTTMGGDGLPSITAALAEGNALSQAGSLATPYILQALGSNDAAVRTRAGQLLERRLAALGETPEHAGRMRDLVNNGDGGREVPTRQFLETSRRALQTEAQHVNDTREFDNIRNAPNLPEGLSNRIRELDGHYHGMGGLGQTLDFHRLHYANALGRAVRDGQEQFTPQERDQFRREAAAVLSTVLHSWPGAYNRGIFQRAATAAGLDNDQNFQNSIAQARLWEIQRRR